MTIQFALTFALTQLAKHSDAPQLDAERLLLHVLRQPETAWLYAHPDHSLTDSEAQGFRQRLAERATGKPLAYILGEWDFYGRPFYVTPDVLIPRPETEHLVDAALEYLARHPAHTIADMGTGSGCIAITLALELGITPLHQGFAGQGNMESRILATDISPAALEVAKKNAQRHGVYDKIEFLEGDMLEPLRRFLPLPEGESAAQGAAGGGGRIDLIVSNPPYVPSAELDGPAPRGLQGKLETLGLKFEPRLALDGGPDGQTFVNQIKNAGIPALVEGTGGDILSFLMNDN